MILKSLYCHTNEIFTFQPYEQHEMSKQLLNEMKWHESVLGKTVQTLKIWHKFSRALSRNSWVFFKHSPLSSCSAPGNVVLVSDEPIPNQDRNELLAATSLEWSDILLAVCPACAMIWISFMTCESYRTFRLWAATKARSSPTSHCMTIKTRSLLTAALSSVPNICLYWQSWPSRA